MSGGGARNSTSIPVGGAASRWGLLRKADAETRVSEHMQNWIGGLGVGRAARLYGSVAWIQEHGGAAEDPKQERTAA